MKSREEILSLALKYLQEGYSYYDALTKAKEENAIKNKNEERNIKRRELMLNLNLPDLLTKWYDICMKVEDEKLQKIALAKALYPARLISFVKCKTSNIRIDAEGRKFHIGVHQVKNNMYFVILPSPLPLEYDNYNTLKCKMALLYSKLSKDINLIKEIFRHAYASYFYNQLQYKLEEVDLYVLQHKPKLNITYYVTFDVVNFVLNRYYPELLKLKEYEKIFNTYVRMTS